MGPGQFGTEARDTHFLSYRENAAHLYKLDAFLGWLRRALDAGPRSSPEPAGGGARRAARKVSEAPSGSRRRAARTAR